VLGDEPQLRCKRSSKADVSRPFGEAESFLYNVKETPSVSSELNVEDLRAGGGFIIMEKVSGTDLRDIESPTEGQLQQLGELINAALDFFYKVVSKPLYTSCRKATKRSAIGGEF